MFPSNAKGPFYTRDWWPREKKNDLQFIVVMVGGVKTMTKRNPCHILKALVTCQSVKQTLD